ncbi:MAG TPA: PQQ-dependent sugar dehydrogenase [Dehalococcoidia bacterium]|nr:PQQ-dependent sugar dehydrogenase [Dehalococcoidia bacterium]
MAALLALTVAAMACSGSGNPAPASSTSMLGQPVVTTFVKGAAFPVDLAFAPDGRLFYNELGGNIRVVQDGRLQAQPFATLTVVRQPGYDEHGLLGLALDPQFESNHFVYVFYSVPNSDGSPQKQRVVRFTDSDGRGTNQTTILDNLPIGPGCCHNGGRLAFGPEGKLYVSLGDTQSQDTAQDLSRLSGKILRVNPDGSVPSDNPFPGSPVFAYGLRNPFGLAFDPVTGDLLATENGPTSSDEINIIRRGGNYGWPTVTGTSSDARYISPIYSTGSRSIAPTGITFYSGDKLPYTGDAFFCSYNVGKLSRIPRQQLDELRVGKRGSVEPITGEQSCVLDVVTGPDGALYFSDAENVYRWG